MNALQNSKAPIEILSNPFQQFEVWYQQAESAHVELPEAMALATASSIGAPTIRYVLLRGRDERGFKFYTNYNSQKARDLFENPQASLCFHWTKLERQVRINGRVEKISDAESDAYWMSRPWDSRISALASSQSEVLDERISLEERTKQLSAKYKGVDVPRPKHWGGFRLVPTYFEFWQGHPHRLHDRVVYDLQNGTWKTYRLQP